VCLRLVNEVLSTADREDAAWHRGNCVQGSLPCDDVGTISIFHGCDEMENLLLSWIISVFFLLCLKVNR